MSWKSWIRHFKASVDGGFNQASVMSLRCGANGDNSSILELGTFVHNHSSACCRYLELVHPIWHKTHFKIRWVHIAFAVILVL